MADWQGPFFARHAERFPHANWPEPGSGWWQDWRRKLTKAGIREEEAKAASEAMFDEGGAPAFPSEHPDALEARVKAAWKANKSPANALEDRETATALSGKCEDCEGSGFARRYRRHSLGKTDAKGHPVGDSALFYCICPLGRWIEHNHQTKASDVRKRMNDLQDHPGLWDAKYRHPPDGEDAPITSTIDFDGPVF